MARLVFRKHICDLALATSFLLVPGKRRQKPPKKGLETASKSNPLHPISRAGSGVSHPPRAQRNNEGHMNATILLVDVASASRDSWKSFLQNHNYQVFTAGDKESAVRQCLQLQPDLVLLHDTLPDICGFDLCRLSWETRSIITSPLCWSSLRQIQRMSSGAGKQVLPTSGDVPLRLGR